MMNSNISQDKKTKLASLSVSELVQKLCSEPENDEIEWIEELICKGVAGTEAAEIKPLLKSKVRDCNIAGLRILSDSGVKSLSEVFDAINPLFEKADPILSRMSMALIAEYSFYRLDANGRVSEFVDSADMPSRRSALVWLLYRTSQQLQEFRTDFGPFETVSDNIIELLIELKLGTLQLADFLSKISQIDDLAHAEYLRLSKLNTRFSRSIARSQLIC